ncbi:hypothetical protein CC1G_13892 [Coprinopsis cinerea okayama7|uniref:Uncharacterized protein n=1 Tax=Coprinopsis cinerea (strain Okayama-7 / 130 / ATCC MYA-4618 / FGSC 9003) TaxID=240176 RepID=D6RKM6_COPC7|nr:hypothetical protein CC1G_13892 [Coprinopsis cinerea okayama7\|eukprot:XP_002911852.1 hypothetical protein CC1G_13892 [Coprinopsis cinerea okayama7\
MRPPSVLNVHSPTSSFAILHSLIEESIDDLYNKLSRKVYTDYRGERVGPGWLKYEYNDSVWNLDDESDYAIFTWRQRETGNTAPIDNRDDHSHHREPVASTSRVTLQDSDSNTLHEASTPVLHLHNPAIPLPDRNSYCNPSYYVFQPSRAHHCHPPPPSGHGSISRTPSRTSKKSRRTVGSGIVDADDGIPNLRKEFEKFHSENGVRTVMGSIGPVENVRMLLKSGHRHVYMSRKFAVKHGFVPKDSTPGNHGYVGLLSIGEWPITLVPSASSPQPMIPYTALPDRPFPDSASQLGGPHYSSQHHNRAHSIKSTVTSRTKNPRSYEHTAPKNGLTPVMVQVYLSEEPHFDVVLGRSFFEKRQVKVNAADPTDVWCLDTGEKIECELVILKDGRGEIVTVT